MPPISEKPTASARLIWPPTMPSWPDPANDIATTVVGLNSKPIPRPPTAQARNVAHSGQPALQHRRDEDDPEQQAGEPGGHRPVRRDVRALGDDPLPDGPHQRGADDHEALHRRRRAVDAVGGERDEAVDAEERRRRQDATGDRRRQPRAGRADAVGEQAAQEDDAEHGAGDGGQRRRRSRWRTAAR